MKSIIKNPKLAAHGANQINWARQNMPALAQIEARFKQTKPFKGLTIGMALHVTKETGVLVETLAAGGAKISIASCNPLSTQDDIAAYLAKKGFEVFAYKGETKSDYYKFIKNVIAARPHITIDDGCDLVTEIHLHHKNLIPQIIGGCEETTTGINRLKAMEKAGELKYPMVAVNDNKTKHMFDNYYGTGQSTWDGILRATNILVAGKTVMVAGYGDCGRGIALRAAGLGAQVIVTEIDPIRSLQASKDGYRVMPMEEASTHGNVFITATGSKHVITADHMKKMKSGAILCNSGHFDIEIDVEGLEALARGPGGSKKQIRPYVEEYKINDKKLYLLAQGRLVNLAAAEGHPSEVMDLSFCGQALACEWLVNISSPPPIAVGGKLQRGSIRFPVGAGNDKLAPAVYTLPPEIDEQIARLKLTALGIQIDSPTPKQQQYTNSWRHGT